MENLKAVLLEESDLAPTAEFLARVFGGTVKEKLRVIEHQAATNPAWREGIPRGWIVKSADGRVIAHTANIPFLYHINNSTGLCCATGSTAVHQEWRGRGLGNIVGRAFIEQRADLLVGVGSTPTALNLWLGLGMKPLKRRWSRHRIVIGNANALLRTKLKVQSDWMLRTGSHVSSYLARRSSAAGIPNLSVACSDGFGQTDDRALAAFGGPAQTYAIRNHKIMEWLYFGSDYIRENRIVFSARVGADLLGYIALRIDGKTLSLLECRCFEQDYRIAGALLRAARDYAEKNNIAYINAWPYTPMLLRAMPFFMSIPTRRSIMTYCYLSKVGDIDESVWEATPGDGDLSIY